MAARNDRGVSFWKSAKDRNSNRLCVNIPPFRACDQDATERRTRRAGGLSGTCRVEGGTGKLFFRTKKRHVAINAGMEFKSCNQAYVALQDLTPLLLTPLLLLKQRSFLFFTPRFDATTSAAIAKTPFETMIGSEMARTLHITQFSQYDRSSHAQPTKYADNKDDTHSNIESAARTPTLFFVAPKIRRVADTAMYRTANGISICFLGFSSA